MRNSFYEGREQTEVKHRILERYLSGFAPIVGNWATDIAYIDCLAGPWESVSPILEDTSFSRALSVLRNARNVLGLRGKTRLPTFRCLWIERDPVAFQRLNSFAQKTEDIEITAKNWDFSAHIQDVVKFAKGHRGSFPFFFIDPTGWELVAINLIKPILEIQPGEVLINLMTSWIKRFLVDESKNFERLVGPEIGRLRQLNGDEQEEELVRCYSTAIRKAGAFDYVCTLPVMKADQDMFHFWMVYGTRHPKGVEVFKDTEKNVIPFMHEIRAEIQHKKRIDQSGGQLSLLSPEATYIEKRFTRLLDKNRELARAQVELMLRNSNEVAYDDVWAKAMQYSLVSERDLREWITQWAEAGNLTMNLQRTQKVPSRKSKHVLRWKGKSHP